MILASVVLLAALAAATPNLRSKFGSDPDEGRDMMEIVEARGYSITEHLVETPDGYLLGMFNIPPTKTNSSNPPVVLLQHGLLDSSWTWVNNFKEESLAFILADRGFDVWCSNNRGNEYSKRHKSVSPDSAAFWSFSWDEMAALDLPSNIAFVLEQTGADQLSYVGHSQGTTQAFSGMSFSPAQAAMATNIMRKKALDRGMSFSTNFTVPTAEWYASKVSLYGALAPVAFVHHQTAILLDLLADIDLVDFLELFGVHDFLPGVDVLQKLDPLICSILPSGCEDLLFLVVGESKNLNTSRMDVYVSETPAGTSVINMAHWAQSVKAEAFQMLDLGKSDNQKYYNSSTPPSYSLDNIQTSVAIFAGTHDDLADPTDVQALLDALSNSIVTHVSNTQDAAHLDFTWGVDAHTLFYEELIAQILAHL